jgi:peptidyl-prolyl cis-trans isomerase B (cyclophilin B)
MISMKRSFIFSVYSWCLFLSAMMFGFLTTAHLSAQASKQEPSGSVAKKTSTNNKATQPTSKKSTKSSAKKSAASSISKGKKTMTPENPLRPQYIISVTQANQSLGEITIELYKDIAPKHAEAMEKMIADGFYNGTAFHRVVPGFVIQGGDPNSKTKPREYWGMGDPSQPTVQAEFSPTPHKRGILSAARRGDNVNSFTSQFFICVADTPFLDNQYTVFGAVVSGMEVADAIVAAPRDGRDNPVETVTMSIRKK